MEIGPEPRRPCDFPGQPAHQNGPRSRPMGMGRAFSCPFLGNSSAPRGAAGARSALKSPGGGRRPPPGDFRLAGSQGPSAPGSRQTPPPPLGRAGVPHGREPRLPPPGRISQPAESVFQEGPPAGNTAFHPCSRAFDQRPLGRVRRAAGLGLPCLGWLRGGGGIPGRAALGFLQRRQGQKPQVFANELQGKGVAGGE